MQAAQRPGYAGDEQGARVGHYLPVVAGRAAECSGGSSGLEAPKAHPFTHQQAFDACAVASGDRARVPSANEAAGSLPSPGSWLVENETPHCFKIL